MMSDLDGNRAVCVVDDGNDVHTLALHLVRIHGICVENQVILTVKAPEAVVVTGAAPVFVVTENGIGGVLDPRSHHAVGCEKPRVVAVCPAGIPLEADAMYDDIGSVLRIKQIQSEKRELLESLELFFKVFVLGEDMEEA